MNTLVDMCENRNIQDSQDRLRRWIPGARATGKKKAYTDDMLR